MIPNLIQHSNPFAHICALPSHFNRISSLRVTSYMNIWVLINKQ